MKVEEIENPPFDIIDNTDDLEPLPANIIKKLPEILPPKATERFMLDVKASFNK